LATEESVTGITEVLQKTEVIPESIRLVSIKAQADIQTNLVLSSFRAFQIQFRFGQKPFPAYLCRLKLIYSIVRQNPCSLKIKEL
jgi:hypothetical protein